MRKSTAVVLLIFANLFWAGNYICGKFVIGEMEPIQINFLRWLIAAVILFPLAQLIERPDWKAIFKEWKLLLVLSILGIIGYNLLLYEALYFTTSLDAALINSVNPAMIAIFAVWLLKEKLSKVNVLGLIVSLVGVLLVLTHGNLLHVFAIDYNAGDLFMLVVIISWTFYTLLSNRIKGLPPIGATAVTVALSVLVMLPFFMYSNFNWSFTPATATGILYLALFPSVGSLLFWNIGVPIVGSSYAGIFLNLITVFTAILSILLGNGINLFQIIGGLVVVLGVYLTNKKPGGKSVRRLNA
ncbi:DMT family transporter [Sporolactobacillus nakayamae]|uniref:Permease of the drug/metabolite transporter (DMT) superfamily n=1 Tax=Sporolactobacillus nakayamae TaxID=269670 RepID=A0A1I2VUQ5_9BACL|nr:DMT family transporter [Sporolactobacillus nakayamae]SFG92087.1 Permease of the drug/metabolite transporter (DMT) superfamily [Sporolactobacillus nakayamae]